MKIFISLLFIVSAFLGGCNKKTSPQAKTHNFTKVQWLGGINAITSSLKLHLNNFTTIKHEFEQDDDSAYKWPNSSLIKFGNTGISFDISVTRQDPYSVYINDVNSSSIQADAHDGLGFITIDFESDGTEIIGDCVNNIACVCGTPRLDLSDIEALIPLALGVTDGAVSVEAQDATFTSGVSESGPCVDNACAFVCDIFFPNKNSDMQKAIAKALENYVNQNSGLLAGALNQFLKGQGVSGPIISVQIKTNGDLTVIDKE